MCKKVAQDTLPGIIIRNPGLLARHWNRAPALSFCPLWHWVDQICSESAINEPLVETPGRPDPSPDSGKGESRSGDARDI